MTDETITTEAAVLGALMLGGEQAMARVGALRPEHFAERRNRRLFELLREMSREAMPVDAITVAEYLERRYPKQAGELSAYVLGLAAGTPGAASVSAYAELMIRRWSDRRVREIASSLLEDPAATEQAIRDLMALHSQDVNREWTMKAAVKEAWEDICEAWQGGGKLRGVTTGIAELDDATGGLHRGDLVVIGARPAMGKTALLLSMCRAASAHPRGLISAEQSAGQIGQRALSMVSHVPVSHLRAGRLDGEFERLSPAVAKLAVDDCVIYDKPAPTLTEVIRTARRWKLDRNIDALYVDYLQRIKHGSDKMPRWERVGEIAEGLKELARELDIPVVTLAQVNRAVDERGNKRPGMGDLADSSAIEKEADLILMLYREEVYNPETQDKGIAELILEKNRHGGIGKFRVAFNAPIVTFAGLAA